MFCWRLPSSSREARSTRSLNASAPRSRRRSPMSDSPVRAASPPYKERSACGKAGLSQYPARSPPIRRRNGLSRGLDFVAIRFRRPVLLLLPAIFAAAAFAQQEPLDLTAPAEAAQKSANSSKAAPAPIPADEAVQRANAWLDAARVMSADFVQIGPNGR